MPRFQIKPMSERDARSIAEWRYDGALSLYDGADLRELLSGEYLAVYADSESVANRRDAADSPIGFYCFGASARVNGYAYGESFVDFGLGLSPAHVGKGLGRAFVDQGIAYAREHFPGKGIRLTVACFNEVAIRVYASLGFAVIARFVAASGVPFYVMTNRARVFVDITRPLEENMRVYSGHEQFSKVITRTVARDNYNLTRFSMGAHCGTHIDAPAHFLEDGLTIDAVPIELLVGPALVVTKADGAGYDDIPYGTTRLIIRSDAYSGVTMEEADILIEKGVRLIGTDRLSVARDNWDLPVHRKLLCAGVWILETLALDEVEDGYYDLICLPLNIVGAEGAPARALLEKRTTNV